MKDSELNSIERQSLQRLKNHQFPVQIEGFPYIVGGVILTLASGLGTQYDSQFNIFFIVLFVLSLLFTLFSLWFYRCPKIQTPQGEPLSVFSPADGTVLKIQEVSGKKIGLKDAKKISIFMSPFNVHVNRAPVAGKIEAIEYVKGKFFKADLDKASEENEHNWVVMVADAGFKVAFVQIAGFVARRIVCYVDKGDTLAAGERYGMIRFGSRMEVVVDPQAKILVQPGDKIIAGVTKLALYPAQKQ